MWIAMAYNKDSQAKARIIARIRLCEIGGKPTGDLHPIGDGVSELRFNFGPIPCVFCAKGLYRHTAIGRW